MRLSCLKRDSRFKIQDSKCEKILIPYSVFRIPHSAFRIPHSERGFTLVEIAMVLVVVGVLVTFGITLIGPLAKRVKYNDTKTIIQADIDGVEGWAYDGKVLPTSGTWSTVVRNTNDAWLAPLYYVYDYNLTAVSTGGICGRSSTYITVTTSTPATITNVGFLVLSGSDDHTIDTTLNGNLNGGAINGVITGSGYATGTVTISDNDIVYWVTLNELRTKAGCKGAQLQILNQELPEGYNGATYSATIEVDPAYAGVPGTSPNKYTWTITGAPGWLTTTPASLGTGDNLTLSGTAATGQTTITVTVADSAANTSKKFLLNIQ